MSDVSAAAAAMNIPEDLVERSAAARAAAAGSSVDEVLAAWAGGAPAPAAEASTSAEPESEPEPAEETLSSEPEPTVEESEPEVVGAPDAAPVSSQPVPPAALPPATPPTLTGRTEHPFALMAGAVALLAVTLLIGFVAPAMPADGNGVYASAVPLSQAGIDGREVYRSEGCGACHTQMVRPIVADAGLGPVTIADSNQVLGSRRYGPDLAHVGSRVESPSSLLATLATSNDHPSYSSLSDTDLENLVTYLFESK